MELQIVAQDRLLAVFAKRPVAGQAKTRLARASSPEWAERVALAFLEDTLARFAGGDWAERAIAFAPADAGDFFARLGRGRYKCIPQAEGDLGQRLKRFFSTARAQGFTRIVAIGADSPTLPGAHIEEAFQLLPENDMVIGPAFDGGYYLIGAGMKELPIFDEIPWGTPRVLEATVRRLRGTSARVALLPPWYDVDTVEDWQLLRGHVLAMREAGIDPAVPCVERLIREQIP